ncbi:hypothetical protein MAPG_10675 [Magnaporthiopsis poae ATCC 64411]|uniref:Uncharacterized protein n=1 Tax=Magnaporthiopsis poae (strain ATCC 64411 / 73-15) TaxID=644358 RepID=A0A0C4ED82_MAGP6|nr:hypothetical protein MAPG_10675 [Magnaporthiopsis poae ATCC 64411]
MRSAVIYAADFERLTAPFKITEKIKINRFYGGLKNEVKNKIVKIEWFKFFNRFRKMARYILNYYFFGSFIITINVIFINSIKM